MREVQEAGTMMSFEKCNNCSECKKGYMVGKKGITLFCKVTGDALAVTECVRGDKL